MELSRRDAIFAAVFNGFLSHQDQFFDDGISDSIRHCWELADRIIYHANNVESPERRANRWVGEDFVIVGTKRTGSGFNDEIISISIIDCLGSVLLDTVVKPSKDVSEEVTAPLRFPSDMVKNAPSWEDILPQVLNLTSRGWVSYHSTLNLRMIEKMSGSLLDHDLLRIPECVKQLYAECNGRWDARQKEYKRESLVDAALELDVDPGVFTHQSLHECKLALGVIRAIAGGAV